MHYRLKIYNREGKPASRREITAHSVETAMLHVSLARYFGFLTVITKV